MPYYVNKYSISRVYGGPEEGGWWYDVGLLEDSVAQFVDPEEAIAHRDYLETLQNDFDDHFDRYSVLGGDDTEFIIEDHPGANFPQERPHYE